MVWVRRVLVGGGVALTAYAALNVARAASVGTLPYLRFLFVSAVFADALVIPLVLAAGAITARLLPGWVRVPVQAALYATTALVLISLPLLLGYGRAASLPSALPRDYPRGLLLVLGVVWAAALVTAVIRRLTPAGGPQNGSRP